MIYLFYLRKNFLIDIENLGILTVLIKSKLSSIMTSKTLIKAQYNTKTNNYILPHKNTIITKLFQKKREVPTTHVRRIIFKINRKKGRN